MGEVQVQLLSEGDVLSRPVRGKNGLVMLEAGTVLTEQYIRRLKGLGVSHVSLEARGGASVNDRSGTAAAAAIATVPEDSVQPEAAAAIAAERLKNNDDARKEACEIVVKLAMSEQATGRLAAGMMEDRFRRQFRGIVTEIVTQRAIAEELGVLLQTDRYLFDHSLQVALLSFVVGMAKSYDMASLYELTAGALLFDIGMTRLPASIVKSRTELTPTERARVRKHTITGYEILSGIPGMSAASARCALMHHERYRGNGYPFGLKHEDIPEYARIVGLADHYDALISPRHYRKPFTFGEAMEYLFAAGNYDFDLDLVQIFLRNVSMYPASVVVRLSNGQIGVVADVEHSLNHRPVVRIMREADGTKVAKPYEIDLLNYRDLVIVHAALEEYEKD